MVYGLGVSGLGFRAKLVLNLGVTRVFRAK